MRTIKTHWRLFAALAGLAGIAVCALLMLIVSGFLMLQGATPDRTPLTAPTPTIEDTAFAASPMQPTITPSPTLAQPFAATASATQSAPTQQPAISPTHTRIPATSTPATNPDCPPPAGWVLHEVQPGETLFAYVLGAISVGEPITTHDVRAGNCLTSDLLSIGQILYLPPDAAENAPPSEPIAAPGTVNTGPRTAQCDPHCTISIRPGWRAEQIAAAIDTIPVGFWGNDFLNAISAGAAVPPYEFLASKPPGNILEGYLYPGTYELQNSTTAADFRDMLLTAFATQYTPDMANSATAHGLSFYQALTLASIIQRESWATSEQVVISSVFHNRLRSGTPLGSTVTIQYAFGGPTNWWPRVTGSQINTASPYNTNINSGLPPSPISSPGIDALRAALAPADTNYLFFTGNCRGSGNLYAATYDEHMANVNACR